MTNVSIGIASGGIDPKSPEQGCIYRNNTVNGPNGLTLLAYSTAVGNTVTGSVTLNQGATATNNTITGKVTVKKGSTVTGNTINGNVTVSANSSDYTGSTITGNTINGTVTFATNSKNNTLTRNVITSTGSYAVVMASTADANNTVQYNTLIAATKKGDEAVNPSTGSGNTISYNSNIALMLADGTKDAANWTATVGTSTTANPLPVGGLNEGDAVTLTYGGRLKVKSVTATTDAAPDAWDGDLSKLTAESTAEFATATDGMTITGRLGANVKVSIAADATVTLDGVIIVGDDDENYKWAGLNCLGDATIILKDGTQNSVKGFHSYYPGIHVPAGSTLTITGGSEGNGELTAISSGYGAGIGGGYQIPCGNIYIQGGNITARGGIYGAGIGGGYQIPCGNIYIQGGNIMAMGGPEAAGIGGGSYGSCGAITITNDVTRVYATKGGEDAPYSIGAGNRGSCVTVSIGGTVYWENNAAVDNYANTYLGQSSLYYRPTPQP